MAKDYPYLKNVSAAPTLLGLAPLLNPFSDHVSAQRLTMWSSHLNQVQILHGNEFPRVCSGWEPMVGTYEFDPTASDQDRQVIAVIPRIIPHQGIYPINVNPYYTIIYRGCRDDKIGYFNYNLHTMRSDGYGYKNIQLRKDLLSPGTLIPANTKLITSPAHHGNMYNLGTNLNTCFMSIPQITEDAFVISESAARKLCSDGYGKISFKIGSNQIPLDLYGSDDEYKFIPDIGEHVRDDGLLCALRTPSADTMIYDTAPENLRKVQHLHDSPFYVPKGSEIVDIEVVVNRKNKVKTPMTFFTQVQKYREPTDTYCMKVVETYQKVIAEGRECDAAFNALVTRCMSNLIIDGIKVPNLGLKIKDLQPYRRKEPIEFIYVTVTYRYEHTTSKGFKTSNRSGGKGTLGAIWPDECMPVDEHGIRADMIKGPVSVFNRMNPSQWYEHFMSRGAMLLTMRIREKFKTPQPESEWLNAFATVIDYLKDCNPSWGELAERKHPTNKDKCELVQDVLDQGIYIQVTPFTKGIDQHWVIKMAKKWGIDKTPVTYKAPFKDGTWHTITTKEPVMIGTEYFFLLYKMPHLRCCSLGYANQYRSPVRANALAKLQYPISQTSIRFGEDEIRNILMTSGAETAAYILGTYANSHDATMNLGRHLLFDEHPTALEDIDLSLTDIIKSNSIISLTRHLFSCVGVNIAPTEEEVRAIISDREAVDATEEVNMDDGDKLSE